MKIYLAPMEGITGYVYRNALQHLCEGTVEKYYTPFIVPRPKRGMHDAERRDLLPENNQNVHLVPQILTANREDFTKLAMEIHGLYGYEEINLNLGCPSRTVVSRGKGAGFLAHPKELQQFLQGIFQDRDRMGGGYEISVKTRLGMEDPEEIWNLLKIYQQFPIQELTVHVRVQSDYYKKPARREYWKEICQRYPGVVYNGDIYSVQDYTKSTFDTDTPVMLGRGVIRNPFLPLQLFQRLGNPQETIEAFHKFYQEIYAGYQKEMEIVPAIYHMKELLSYVGDLFVDGEKARKRIRKAKNKQEFDSAVRELMQRPMDLSRPQGLFIQ